MTRGTCRAVTLLVTIVFMLACEPKTKTETHYITNNDLSQFKDVNAENQEIQDASKAVVKISGMGGSGTGTFVSSDGLLLTNDHVLGQDNCLRDGCFVNLVFNLQKGSDEVKTVLAWAQPVYVDTGADFHFVKMFHTNEENGEKVKGQALQTPNYLKMASDTNIEMGNADSSAEDYYVIGHPLSMLKKVLTTKVVKLDGHTVTLQKYLLPGNSGSALLNKNMEIVGVVHSSAFMSFAIAKDGIEGTAYGTHASRFPKLSQLNANSGLSGIGVDKFKTPEDLDPEDEEHLYYALALGKFPEQYPAPQELVQGYFEDCKEELEDVKFAEEKVLLGEPDAPKCSAMMTLIQCEYAESDDDILSADEAESEHPAMSLLICPEQELRAEVQTFVESMLKKRADALGKFSVSEAQNLLESFYTSEDEFSTEFHRFVSQFKDDIPRDFETLSVVYDSKPLRQQLIAGTGANSTLEMVRNFRQFPYYNKQAISILSLSAQLYGDQKITKDEMKAVWARLKSDPKVTPMEVWLIDFVEHLLADSL